MNNDLEDWLDDFDHRVQLHGFESAEAWVLERHPEEAEQIVSTYWDRIGELFTLKRGLADPEHERWYLPKPDHESPRWAYAVEDLRDADDVHCVREAGALSRLSCGSVSFDRE